MFERYRDLQRVLNDAIGDAVSRSKWISYSDIAAFCFDPENWMDEAGRFFETEIRPEDLEGSQLDLKEILDEWLGTEPVVTDELLRIIDERLGSADEILILADESDLCGRMDDGQSAFFFTEGVVLARFREAAVMFIIGNFE